jgi:TPR repeat protein
MKKLVAAIILITSVIACSDEFSDAVDAHDKGDYNTALKKYKSLARRGDGDAQFNLGLMYYNAEGVEKDYKQALGWFTLAAEQGDSDAQYMVGAMYDKGRGVLQDYKQAVRWYTLAAEQGNAKAQYAFGEMHREGHGLWKDYVKAHMWLNIASANGSRYADIKRDFAAAMMNTQQIELAEQMARDCMARNYKDCN